MVWASYLNSSIKGKKLKPQSFGTIQICPQLSNFVRAKHENDIFKKLMHVHKRKDAAENTDKLQ